MLDGEGYSMFDLEMQQQKNMLTEQQKMQTLLKMCKTAEVISSEPRKLSQFGDFTITDKDSFDTALSMGILAQTEQVEKKTG
jgi:hypothetical protein